MCNSYALATQISNDVSTLDEQRLESVTEKAASFALALGNPISTKYIPLYNISEQIEAICFSLSQSGYVIISYKTGEIIEYSPSEDSPYKNFQDERCYYNGLLEHYVGNGEEFKQTETLESFSVYEIKENLNETFSEIKPISTKRATVLYGQIDGTLSTQLSTNGGYACVPTCIGIVLSYYGAFPSGVSSSTIRDYLFNNNYIANIPQWLDEAATGNYSNLTGYSGLNSYISRVSGLSKAVVQAYSYNRLYTQIVSNKRPVIMEMRTGFIGESENLLHAVTAYALRYDTNEDNYTYVGINDSWGSNDIWFNLSYMDNSYDIMYMY